MVAEKAIIQVLLFFLSRDYRDYRAVRRLHLFDAEFQRGMAELCAAHETVVPRETGKKRAPQFSVNLFLLQRLVAGAGETADPLLVYFLDYRLFSTSTGRTGRLIGLPADPYPLFDAAFYLHRYFPAGLVPNPFAHYLLQGWRDGLMPGPYFNPEVYRQQSDWTSRHGNPLVHYHQHGRSTGDSPSHGFDIDWYIDKTPVLAAARPTIIRHYRLHGAAAGKSPVPVFDPGFYRCQDAVVETAMIDPFAHYLLTEPTGRARPAEWFDPVYYRHRYLQEDKPVSPLLDYLEAGAGNGHYPNERVAVLPNKPVFSILVPVYNPNHHDLGSCIRSVLYQSYPHWQLCLVDDCSSDAAVTALLNRWAAVDSRIRVARLPDNAGISAATARAAELATGDYFVFLDHDDELTLDCLSSLAIAINERAAPVFYGDEDLVGDDGSRLSVFYKPDFNRELLLSHNYITHPVAIAASFFWQIGGVGGGYDGAQDYDLLLRAAEHTKDIVHIPRILYHWRASATSTSIHHDDKPYAHQAGKRALAASLLRLKGSAEVDDGPVAFHYRVRRQPPKTARVTILCWQEPESQGFSSDLSAQLQARSGPVDCRLLVVPMATGAAEDSLLSRTALLGEAIGGADSEYIAIVGSGGIAISEAWLAEMLAHLVDTPGAGLICGRVAYPNGDGPSYTVPDLSRTDARYFAELLSSMSRHCNGLHNPQLLRCCDWHLCLFRRALFDELGGFDHDSFPHLLGMLDFSWKVGRTGRDILYTPYAVITHAAAFARLDAEPDDSGHFEKRRFQDRYRADLGQRDPYCNAAVLVDNGIEPERFLRWLAGNQEESLDLHRKLH